MARYIRKLATVLVLDVVSILCAATLLLKGFPRTSTGIMVALFLTNALVLPDAIRGQDGISSAQAKNISKLRLLGFALLAASFVQLAFLVKEGLSWPGVAGATAGLLVGVVFLSIDRMIG